MLFSDYANPQSDQGVYTMYPLVTGSFNSYELAVGSGYNPGRAYLQSKIALRQLSSAATVRFEKEEQREAEKWSARTRARWRSGDVASGKAPWPLNRPDSSSSSASSSFPSSSAAPLPRRPVPLRTTTRRARCRPSTSTRATRQGYAYTQTPE